MAEGELPAAIALQVAQTRELVLPGLGTAGYRWSDAVDGEAGIVELDWRRGFPAGDERRPAGASAPERLLITAVAPGRVVLHLVQQRPWEHGRPRSEHVLEVEVLPPAAGPP